MCPAGHDVVENEFPAKIGQRVFAAPRQMFIHRRHSGLGCAHALDVVCDLPGRPDCKPSPGCPGSQLPAECPAHPRQELHQLPSARFETVGPRSDDLCQVRGRWQTRACVRGRFAGTKPRDPIHHRSAEAVDAAWPAAARRDTMSRHFASGSKPAPRTIRRPRWCRASPPSTTSLR